MPAQPAGRSASQAPSLLPVIEKKKNFNRLRSRCWTVRVRVEVGERVMCYMSAMDMCYMVGLGAGRGCNTRMDVLIPVSGASGASGLSGRGRHRPALATATSAAMSTAKAGQAQRNSHHLGALHARDGGEGQEKTRMAGGPSGLGELNRGRDYTSPQARHGTLRTNAR